MAVVILHFIIGFIYLFYKLSPKKPDKKEKEFNKNNEISEETKDN
jgi:hypothetical protein